MSMPPRSRTGSGPLLAGLIIAAVVLVGIVVLAASGATPASVWNSFFPNHGTGGVTDRSTSVQNLYDFVFYIAAAIFLFVEGLIVWTVFRYRRKSTDTDLPPQTHGNNLVEVIWTVIPTAIVLVLFAMSWQSLNTVDAKVPTDVTVRAEAARFQWSFDYLDGNGPDAKTLFTVALPVGDEGGMVLPVGEPVHVELRSDDVIHAFYVPKFLFKRDVVPGSDNTFDFTVEDEPARTAASARSCAARSTRRCFRRPRGVPRRLRRLARGPDREGERDAAARPSGEAAGPPELRPRTSRSTRPRSRRPRTRRSRSTSATTTTACRTTSRSTTPNGGASSRATPSTASRRRTTRSRRSPRARTSSCAPFTRT